MGKGNVASGCPLVILGILCLEAIYNLDAFKTMCKRVEILYVNSIL